MRTCVVPLLLLATVAALPSCAAQKASLAKPAPPSRVRVMTYNIHHGRGADNAIDLQRVADVINRAEVDLVALQEVDVRTRRSGGVDQLAELARLTNMHARFGKGRDFEGGDYGQAILSRRPIASLEVHSLPPANNADRRVALDARIPSDATHPNVRFVGTHLHHVSEEFRVAQAKRLIEILGHDATVILTGDLNAIPDSPTMNLLLAGYADTIADTALTYPASQPVKKIDWVLLPNGSRWRVVNSLVVDEQIASDHRPVVVELELVGR